MYFFYPLIAALDGHDGITYILKHIPYQLSIVMSGFYGHGHCRNNFSPRRDPATVPATFDRSPTRSFQNVARSFLVLLQEGVEGLRDAIKGTSPLHQAAQPQQLRTSLITTLRVALPPSTYDREPTVKGIHSQMDQQPAGRPVQYSDGVVWICCHNKSGWVHYSTSGEHHRRTDKRTEQGALPDDSILIICRVSRSVPDRHISAA
jgi:hypothetical protein